MKVEQTTRAAIGARIPLWITIVVILGALLSLVGAVVSKVDPTLLTGGGPLTDAARVYTDYTFARDLAVSIVLLTLLVLRARLPLASVMTLVALIQIIDTLDDLTRGAFALAPGLLFYAILFLLGAWALAGRPRWRRGARRAD
ncbi:MAG TPA: hypothetical protein VHI51_00545 [Ktedonobacterales bacterium]|nr:hypothetical protein [Ktedonobacterales bacterium]